MIFKRQQSASKAAICSQAHAQSNLLTFGVHVPKLCLGFRLNLLLCLCVSQCIFVRLLLTEPTKCSTGHMSYSLCRQQKIVKLPVPKNGTCLFSFKKWTGPVNILQGRGCIQVLWATALIVTDYQLVYQGMILLSLFIYINTLRVT